MEILCQGCRRKLRFPDAIAGKIVTCPACFHETFVRDSSADGSKNVRLSPAEQPAASSAPSGSVPTPAASHVEPKSTPSGVFPKPSPSGIVPRPAPIVRDSPPEPRPPWLDFAIPAVIVIAVLMAGYWLVSYVAALFSTASSYQIDGVVRMKAGRDAGVLEGGTVVFEPTTPGIASGIRGVINGDGTFQANRSGEGIEAGDYKVLVVPLLRGPIDRNKRKSPIDDRYQHRDTTPFKAKVERGSTHFEYEVE